MARTFNTVVAVLFAAFMMAAVAVDASAGASTRKMLSAGLGAPSAQCIEKCNAACGDGNVCQVASGILNGNVGVCLGVDACGNLVKLDVAGCCCWCKNDNSIVKEAVHKLLG
jgi:hypothetical protein